MFVRLCFLATDVLMAEYNWTSIEDLQRFRQLELVSDSLWELVIGWPALARDTVGKQLIRAVDSVGANLVEGDGRFHHKEN